MTVLIAQPGVYARQNRTSGGGGTQNTCLRTIRGMLKRMGYDYREIAVEANSTAITQAYIDNFEFVIIPEISATSLAFDNGQAIRDLCDGTLNVTTFVWLLNNAANTAYITSLVGADSDASRVYNRYTWGSARYDMWGGGRTVATGYESNVTPLITLVSTPAQMLTWKIEQGSSRLYVCYCGQGVDLQYGAFLPCLQEAINAGEVSKPPKKAITYFDNDHFPEKQMSLIDAQNFVESLPDWGVKFVCGMAPGYGVRTSGTNSFRDAQAGVYEYCASLGDQPSHIQWTIHNHDWYWDKTQANAADKRNMDLMFRADVRRMKRKGFYTGPADKPYAFDGFMHNPFNSISQDAIELWSGRHPSASKLADPNSLLEADVRGGYGFDWVRIQGGRSWVTDQGSFKPGDRYGKIEVYGVKLMQNTVLDSTPYADDMVADSADEIQNFAQRNAKWIQLGTAFGTHALCHSPGFIINPDNPYPATYTGPEVRYFDQCGAIAKKLPDVHSFGLPRDEYQAVGDNVINPFLPDDLSSCFFWIDFSDPTTTWQDAAKTPNTGWADVGDDALYVENQFSQRGVADAVANGTPVVATNGIHRCVELTIADSDSYSAPITTWTEGGNWTGAFYILLNDASVNSSFLGQRLDGDNRWNFYIEPDGDFHVYVELNNVVTQWNAAIDTSTNDIFDGAWHVVMLEVDRTTNAMRLFVDDMTTAVAVDTAPAIPASFHVSNDLFILGNSTTGIPWNGSCKHFLLFDELLSVADKTAISGYIGQL